MSKTKAVEVDKKFRSFERIVRESIEKLISISNAKAATQVFAHFERQIKLSPSVKE